VKHSEGFLNLVRDAKSRVRETDVATIRRRIEQGERFHLIDVREDHEWEKGRIPGAVHLGRGIIERDVEQRIPDRDAGIVLYCGGGYRSALAADNLQKMGYRNVLSMDGGFRGWKEAGGRMEQGSGSQAPPATSA
jgi:rhodanese-related sulfurtransferase